MKPPFFILRIICIAFLIGFIGCRKEQNHIKSTPQTEREILYSETSSYMAKRFPQWPQGKELIEKKGSIVLINPDIGQMIIRDESGNEIFLYADKDMNLADLNKGDPVEVEYTHDKFIDSIIRR